MIRVAVPVPLYRLFDYLPVPDTSITEYRPGCRVKVPFGNKQLIGILIETAESTEMDAASLKPAIAILEAEPVLDSQLLQLCRWGAEYYQHPLGEVLAGALPSLLRQGEFPTPPVTRKWRITSAAQSASLPARAARQLALLACLQQYPRGLSEQQLRARGFTKAQIDALAAKQLIDFEDIEAFPDSAADQLETPLHLSDQQRQIVTSLCRQPTHQAYLLFGVTGSGKTEVYLQWIQHLRDAGRQVLVLIPEIGLTPQTLSRFQLRFGDTVGAYHSGLNDNERAQTWLGARNGSLGVVIGTRSAVFLGFKNLGAIIIDEEHDASFKQQEGFRYSARDLAVVRAKLADIPILLGSATPALETLQNCESGKYQRLNLPLRAGTASAPSIELLDIRSRPLQGGIAAPLLDAMREHLQQGQQALVFINRRGFAPVLMCHDCGWIAECDACDSRMTLHKTSPHLRCHHCDRHANIPPRCPQCDARQLKAIGVGTERTEEELQALFPDVPLYRIDSDSTRGKQRLSSLLRDIQQDGPAILVGTQILAKGHHFPKVTLVAVINADSALFSSDFRATERMAQTLVQVAGRAGRGDQPGQVVLQTHHSDHPLLQRIASSNYEQVAKVLLQERQEACLPPFSALALLRCEAVSLKTALHWLQQQRQALERLAAHYQLKDLGLCGPMPAPMERRAGRFRAQLHISAGDRANLRRLLSLHMPELSKHRLSRQLRWSLDIDPVDTL